jgi:hypothetical protein
MTPRNPRINEVMLAEAVRQLLPLAEFGLRAVKTSDLLLPFRRAEYVLNAWVHQGRGRTKMLDGPLPKKPIFNAGYFIEVECEDTAHSIPVECLRPKRKRNVVSTARKPKL